MLEVTNLDKRRSSEDEQPDAAVQPLVGHICGIRLHKQRDLGHHESQPEQRFPRPKPREKAAVSGELVTGEGTQGAGTIASARGPRWSSNSSIACFRTNNGTKPRTGAPSKCVQRASGSRPRSCRYGRPTRPRYPLWELVRSLLWVPYRAHRSRRPRRPSTPRRTSATTTATGPARGCLARRNRRAAGPAARPRVEDVTWDLQLNVAGRGGNNRARVPLRSVTPRLGALVAGSADTLGRFGLDQLLHREPTNARFRSTPTPSPVRNASNGSDTADWNKGIGGLVLRPVDMRSPDACETAFYAASHTPLTPTLH